MAQQPDEVGAHIVAALAFINQEDYPAAVYAAERALALEPASSDAAHVLGLVAIQMDEMLRAEELLRLAHNFAPNSLEHAEALSIVNARLGRLHDALFYGKLSTVLVGDDSKAGLLPDWLGTFEEALAAIDRTNFVEAGLAQLVQGDRRAAVESIRKGLEAEPNNAEGWRGLRDALVQDDRPYEALLAAQSLEAAGQGTNEDLASAGEILATIGRVEEANACFVEAIEQDSINLGLRSRFLNMQGAADLEPVEEILRQETLWAGALPPMPAVSGHDPGKEHLTIGILSGGLTGGQLMEIVWPLFDASAFANIAVNMYSNNARDDALSRRLRGRVAEWTDIGPTDDLTASAIIGNDDVDILIDLDGHRPCGRPGLAARHPAPIVLRWAGVPLNSDGGSERQPYDGVIGDPVLYPNGDARCTSISVGAFALPAEATIEEPAVIPPGVPLRVGLQILRRQLTPELVDFMEKTTKASDAIEFYLAFDRLGGMPALDDIDPVLEEKGIFKKVGISQPSNSAATVPANFLAECDILLDPGPDSNAALVWEALSRSKPVFTVSGRQPSSRVTASVMTGLGLDEIVHDNLDSLSEGLVSLADDTDAINNLLARTHDAVVAECAPERVSARATAFFKSLAAFRKAFFESGR